MNYSLPKTQPLYEHLVGSWFITYSDVPITEYYQLVAIQDFWRMDREVIFERISSTSATILDKLLPTIVDAMIKTDHWAEFHQFCKGLNIHPVTALGYQIVLQPIKNDLWVVPTWIKGLYNYVHTILPQVNDFLGKVKRTYRNNRPLDLFIRNWTVDVHLKDLFRFHPLNGSYCDRPSSKRNKLRMANFKSTCETLTYIASDTRLSLIQDVKDKGLTVEDGSFVPHNSLPPDHAKRIDGFSLFMAKNLNDGDILDEDLNDKKILEYLESCPMSTIVDRFLSWKNKTQKSFVFVLESLSKTNIKIQHWLGSFLNKPSKDDRYKILHLVDDLARELMDEEELRVALQLT